jgi:hypothetical protein
MIKIVQFIKYLIKNIKNFFINRYKSIKERYKSIKEIYEKELKGHFTFIDVLSFIADTLLLLSIPLIVYLHLTGQGGW